MIFYPSKCHNALNGRAFRPEWVCGRAMLNPKYGAARLSVPVPALVDSGAFQDIDTGLRLLPWTALSRQLAYIRTVAADLDARGYPAWQPEGVMIYDQMAGVDEALIDGKKQKVRGTEETARPAIAATLQSAAYYASQRARIRGAIAFVGQGVTPRQYVQECVVPLLDLMQPGDWFAFGGFCIIGRVPSLKPLFVETVRATLPLLARKGIRRAHLLGVAVTDMVRFAAEEGRRAGIAMSLDTSSIEVNSVLGKVFDGRRWVKRYDKADKYTAYHPCTLAEANLLYYDAFCRWLGERDSAGVSGTPGAAPFTRPSVEVAA